MRQKNPPVIVIKKSRKLPDVEVVFTPEPNLEIIHCPKSYAKNCKPQLTAKPRAKIQFNQEWRT